MHNIRYRQIHLDFHTSEYIENIGSGFDSDEFAYTLNQASVDSITCFARCHHGWLYYQSQKHPGLIHPQLKEKNLLVKQINACHNYGIKVPVYTTVQWDARIMREHPEWLSIGSDGKFINTQNIPDPHFYHTICLNSPYRDFFKEHLSDIVDSVGAENIDGFFMDILFQVDCACQYCRSQMKQKGMDAENKSERLKYSAIMLDEFKYEISSLIHQLVPNCGIFYNSSHVGPKTRSSFLNHYSHLELESLPSGGWGYDHFPATSRYARTLGMDMIGMTGKFHTYWGDFHSLKNKAALEFECFQMLAMGAGCSIGDQLHPSCQLSASAYDLIGDIYASVKEKEPWCKDSVSAARIAVLTPEEFYPEDSHDLGISPSLIGAVRMLQELSHQFDIIDSSVEFTNYELLILPDVIYYKEHLEEKLTEYISKGGKVLGSYDSCFAREKENNIYGIDFLSESQYYREFVMPNEVIGRDLPKEELVMYLRGYDVKPKENIGSKTIMDKIKPWFDRSGKTFCSHQHAPSNGQKGNAAVVKYKNVIYFSHPVFALYRKNAPNWCKHMIKDAIRLLLPVKQVDHSGPSTIITSLNKQKQHNRDILHILHYITEKRSEDIYTIEDIIPLYDTKFSLYTGGKNVRDLTSVPENVKIPFDYNGDYIDFIVDRINGHKMVCVQYENE